MPRAAKRFWDPEGKRHGLPTYPWNMAPDGLATVRQLAARGLRPNGQPVVAQLMWSLGRGRVATANLYRVENAAPKRPATAGNMRAVKRMIEARSTCKLCKTVFDFCLSRRLGRLCWDCSQAVNR